MKRIAYKNTLLAILLLLSLTQCKPDLAGKRPWNKDERESNSGQKRVKLEKEPAAPIITSSPTADLSIGKKEQLDNELLDYTQPTTLTADLSAPNTPIKAELTQEKTITTGMQMPYQASTQYNQNIYRQQSHEQSQHLQEQEKEEVTTSPTTTLDFKQLPKDLFYDILSYLTPEEINYIVKNVSKYFYQHITGYNQPGIVGYQNKPNLTVPVARLGLNNRKLYLNHILPGEKKLLKALSGPSFFYQQVGTLSIDANSLVWLAFRPPIPTEAKQGIISLAKLAITLTKALDNHGQYKLKDGNKKDGDVFLEKIVCDMDKILQHTDLKTLKLLAGKIGGEELFSWVTSTLNYSEDLALNKLFGSSTIHKLVHKLINFTLAQPIELLNQQFERKEPINNCLSFPHLHTLQLDGSKIRIEQVVPLTTILTHMSGSLHTLNLVDVITYRPMASLVENLPHKIKKFKLWMSCRNNSNKAGVAEFAQALKKPSLEILSVEGIEIFNNLAPNLKKLRLIGHELTTAEKAKIPSSLKHHTSLDSLTIDASELGDEGAIILFNNLPSHLKKLNILDNKLTLIEIDKIASPFKNNTSLKSLNVSHNFIGDEISTMLAKNLPPQLKKLHLAFCDISAEGAIKIAKALRTSNSKLHSLDLMHNNLSGLSEKGRKEFAQNLPHHLQYLSLGDFDMGVEELIKLVKMLEHAHVHTLALCGKLNDKDSAELIKNLPLSLYKLDLYDMEMSHTAAIIIAQTLKYTHSKLHTLVIKFSDLKSGILEIGRALDSSNIQEVDLRDNKHANINPAHQRQLVQQHPRIRWLF